MSIDLFTAQEMIPSAEFSPDKQLKIYDVLRCIKYDTENKLFEPKTKLGDFFTEKQNKQKKIDLNVIKFKVQRLLRNAGFNDHGAFTGLWDRSLKLQKDDARKIYYHYDGKDKYEREHIRPIKAITYVLIGGYLLGYWDCDVKTGEPTEGVRWLQSIIFPGMATLHIEKNNHQRLTNYQTKYMSSKGLDDKDILVTLRDNPEVLKEVFDHFDSGMHYKTCKIEFYPRTMEITSLKNRDLNIKTYPGLLTPAFIKLTTKKVNQKRIEKYLSKKDKQKVKVKHDFWKIT